VAIARVDWVISVVLADFREQLRRIACDLKCAIVQAPFEQLNPVEMWDGHRLNRIDDRDAVSHGADVAPKKIVRVDLLGPNRPDASLASMQLARMVIERLLPARDTGRDFRPDRAWQRVERIG
jgi:hypothetical protein